MPLTDTAARQAKARTKPYKLADQGGLYLWVAPSGTKSWRYDFRHAGRRYTLTLGLYARPEGKRPDVTLEQARERHSEARKLVAAGQNPAVKKQEDRQKARHAATNSFEAVAEEWLEKRKDLRSEDWLEAMRRWFKRDVYPTIGSRPIEDVTAEDVRGILRKILKRGTHRTAEYTRGRSPRSSTTPSSMVGPRTTRGASSSASLNAPLFGITPISRARIFLSLFRGDRQLRRQGPDQARSEAPGADVRPRSRARRGDLGRVRS